MKKHVLLLSALIPLFAIAGKGVNSGKPVKQVSNASPSVNYTTIQHVTQQGAVNAPFIPSPFLSLKSNSSLKSLSVTRDPKSGMPIMIENISYSGIVTSENNRQATQQVLETISALIGIQSPDEFQILHTEKDNLGITHVKLQQTFKGLPVYGAQAWLHFSADGKACFSGRTQITPALVPTAAALSEGGANIIVRNDVSKQHPFQEFSFTDEILLRLKQYESELVIFPDANRFGKFNLAWHVTVRPNVLNRWEYFVDATTGAILNKYDNTCTLGPATATAVDLQGITRTIGTFNANSKYYLLNGAKSMYTGPLNALPNAGQGFIVTLDAQNTSTQQFQYTDITSNTNTWNNPKGISAHYNAETAWDYFKSSFNRNSINGNGGDVVSFINVADDGGGGLDNAFWNGQYMFYGNGNVMYKPLAGGLDVGGHEMTHGVVQETANLEYQGESGAMNESFADVFGTLIDRSDWKVGEDVVMPGQFAGGCLRDLQNPHNGGNSLADNGWQPAHMNEKYTGTGDNGGVHINSGIPNHAYYLIANALGKNVAEQIYYRALSLYLTKSSQFIDLRLAVVKAAEDLHGAGSSQSNTVKQSFDAVGIGNGSGTNTTPTLPTNPGSNKIILVDVDPNDPNSLYLTDDNVANFTPISQTNVALKKPSVTDDGSYAVFVGADHNIYSIQLTSPFTQTQMTSDGYWDNVAISKDGTHLAANSQFQDTAIWVYDFTLQQWGKFHLYNPTTGQGVDAGGVLYADALEWSHDGVYVMYDSYNKLNGLGGQSLDFWDIGFLRVWNNSTHNFNDGEIFKAYNSLDEGISIGNPAFAKNSPYIIAFDYINTAANEYTIVGANLETNQSGVIFQNTQLGFPSYNPQDTRVAFNAIDNQSQPIIAFINVDGTKITGNAGTAVGAVNLGGYAEWFGTGVRQLPSSIEETETSAIKLYPNPADSKLNIELPEDFKQGALGIYNLLGEKLLSRIIEDSGVKSLDVDVQSLSSGVYLLRLQNDSKSFVQRFEKH